MKVCPPHYNHMDKVTVKMLHDLKLRRKKKTTSLLHIEVRHFLEIIKLDSSLA